MGKLNQLRVMMRNQGTGRENCYEKMRQFVRMIGGKLAMRIPTYISWTRNWVCFSRVCPFLSYDSQRSVLFIQHMMSVQHCTVEFQYFIVLQIIIINKAEEKNTQTHFWVKHSKSKQCNFKLLHVTLIWSFCDTAFAVQGTIRANFCSAGLLGAPQAMCATMASTEDFSQPISQALGNNRIFKDYNSIAPQ